MRHRIDECTNSEHGKVSYNEGGVQRKGNQLVLKDCNGPVVPETI